MVSQTEAQRLRFLSETKTAAFALIDDLDHIRHVLTRDTQSRGDIRRLSTLLRRILMDGDLRKIAAPRLGRITILAPQLKSFHKYTQQGWIDFFFGGKFQTPGGSVKDFSVSYDGRSQNMPESDGDVLLNTEQYLAQRVLCYRNHWITRKTIIKYVTLVSHAAHSIDPARDKEFEFLHHVKDALSIRPQNGFPTVELSEEAAFDLNHSLRFDDGRIDLSLAQLHSTAMYLVESPQVIELESIIQAEKGVA